ncbi:MAG: MSMEG_1061 family FMN-dependent PPOX-type flavoprotein [Actinomycetota bacterium]|nr:MSMEG_1061 family FMN-dependent PPOX-type flavoprotein [Actinomycetota bacterium]
MAPNGQDHLIGDEAALRDRYRPASKAVLEKSRPKIDPKAAGFIAASPFVVLATTSDSGTDASPRGGPPGFVKVLDEHHLAFGDLSGNNRLDSYANVVTHDRVGLLFLVPNVGETLRVNGRARVTTDPAVLERTQIDDGRTPKVALVVEVDECFIHCAKALRRSSLWEPGTWAPAGSSPSAAEVITDQFQLDIDPKVIETDLEADYEATLWEQGGR